MNICYVVIASNKPGERIAIVKQGEQGYYPAKGYDAPSDTADLVQEFVNSLNARMGIPADVAESALHASMFGWHVPAAARANHFFASRPEMIAVGPIVAHKEVSK